MSGQPAAASGGATVTAASTDLGQLLHSGGAGAASLRPLPTAGPTARMARPLQAVITRLFKSTSQHFNASAGEAGPIRVCCDSEFNLPRNGKQADYMQAVDRLVRHGEGRSSLHLAKPAVASRAGVRVSLRPNDLPRCDG